jgi:hypothetical protein
VSDFEKFDARHALLFWRKSKRIMVGLPA